MIKDRNYYINEIQGLTSFKNNMKAVAAGAGIISALACTHLLGSTILCDVPFNTAVHTVANLFGSTALMGGVVVGITNSSIAKNAYELTRVLDKEKEGENEWEKILMKL